MQYLNTRKAIGLILALAFFIGGTHTALAVGTASGATISNTATVDYDVAGDARSALGAAPNITVDNRVDLTVANLDAGNNVNVTPGSTDRILTYTVTNTGNTAQGYLLTTDIPTANIPMGNIRVYVDDPDSGTIGSWDASDPLYTPGGAGTGNFANLFPGGEFAVGASTTAGLDHDNGVGGRTSVTVFIVADTPAAAADTNTDDVRLVAQTANEGTDTASVAAGAPTAGVDVVFADGGGTTSEPGPQPDGYHSAAATYTVASAALTAAKTIAATTDEFGTGFAIPGAVVRYLITITNGGAGAVDNNTVVVSDPIPADTKLCVVVDASVPLVCTAADVPTFTAGTSGLTGVAFEYSDDNGTTWTYVPVADADGADTNITDVRQAPTGAMVSTGAFTVTIGVVIE